MTSKIPAAGTTVAAQADAIAGISDALLMTPLKQAQREQGSVVETPIPAGATQFTALFPVGYDEVEIQVDHFTVTAAGNLNWYLTNDGVTPLTGNTTGMGNVALSGVAPQTSTFSAQAYQMGMGTSGLWGALLRFCNSAKQNSIRTLIGSAHWQTAQPNYANSQITVTDSNVGATCKGIILQLTAGTFYTAGTTPMPVVRCRGIRRYT